MQHALHFFFSLEVITPLIRLIVLSATAFLVLLAFGLRLRQTLIVPAGAGRDREPAIRKLRPVTENEVIARFLQNEFYHPDFDQARREFAGGVLHPNLEDEQENARRRQLLFHKRGALWRELPPDTAWWEVAISPAALGRIRVFPRADWRRYAQRGYSLPQFASRIADRLEQVVDPFLSSLGALRQQIVKGGVGGSVLLIGIDEEKPLTIIEGNHRMVAAVLTPSPQLQEFRFYCGFSAKMSRCCWYQSSFANLLHYASNLLRDWRQFRHSDVARLIPRKRMAAGASAAIGAQPKLQLSATTAAVSPGVVTGDSKADSAA